MTISKVRVQGSSNLGVFVRAVADYVFLPRGSKASVVEEASQVLGKTPLTVDVYSSKLLGLFIAGNSNALLLPPIVSPSEYQTIRDSVDVEVHILNTNFTALGNVILANDYGALVHPKMSDREVEELGRILKVKVMRGKIADVSVVGSVCVVTNRGCAVTPYAEDHEVEALKELFQVDECIRCTVNDGISYVKLGLVASDSGALVGYNTTPYEIECVAEALKIEP